MEPRMSSRLSRNTLYAILLLTVAPATALASSEHPAPNFTGPLVTPAVNTLPAGMLNVEPYLIYTNVRGHYGNAGARHTRHDHARQWQVALPMIYGLGDTTALQLTLSAGRTSTHGGHTDGMRMGDSALRLQQRLTDAGDGTGWVTAVSLAQRLPTGQYHHLDTNPLNGLGNGMARTTLAYGVQKLQWLPDGQALRWRGQVAWSPSPGRIHVHGTSVYGTGRGFHGTVRQGQAWSASAAAEYALNAQWVLVGEAILNRTGTVHVAGSDAWGRYRHHDHNPTEELSLAPAVEYHFSSTLGLIAGVQFTVAGRNAPAYVAPQAALNMVF
jgi:hypothetical protein